MKNKTVLVTGASKGLGQAIALAFAKEGYNVFIHYHLDYENARKTQGMCQKHHVATHLYSCDVSSTLEVKEMIKECVTTFDSIDVLISNAGITKDRLLLMMSEADFDEVMSVNTKGLFNVVKWTAKVMAKQKYGVVLAIGSSVGHTGNIGQSNYTCSKAATVGFIKSAALELAIYNIRCNVISPGLFDSKLSQQLTDTDKDKLLNKAIIKKMI